MNFTRVSFRDRPDRSSSLAMRARYYWVYAILIFSATERSISEIETFPASTRQCKSLRNVRITR